MAPTPARLHQPQLAYASWQRVTHTKLPPPRAWSEHGQQFGLLQCGEILAKVGGGGRPYERLWEHYRAESVIIDVAHADVALTSFVSWRKAIEATSRVGKHRRPVLVSQHLWTDYLSKHSKNCSDKGRVPNITAGRALLHIDRIDVGQLSPEHPQAVVDLYEISRRAP